MMGVVFLDAQYAQVRRIVVGGIAVDVVDVYADTAALTNATDAGVAVHNRVVFARLQSLSYHVSGPVSLESGLTDQHSTAGRAPSRVGITRTVPPGRSGAVRGYPARPAANDSKLRTKSA